MFTITLFFIPERYKKIYMETIWGNRWFFAGCPIFLKNRPEIIIQDHIVIGLVVKWVYQKGYACLNSVIPGIVQSELSLYNAKFMEEKK